MAEEFDQRERMLDAALRLCRAVSSVTQVRASSARAPLPLLVPDATHLEDSAARR
jgi:hypothetical protein